MYLVVRKEEWKSINETSHYVEFSHNSKERCEAWLTNQTVKETIEEKEKKDYSIYHECSE